MEEIDLEEKKTAQSDHEEEIKHKKWFILLCPYEKVFVLLQGPFWFRLNKSYLLQLWRHLYLDVTSWWDDVTRFEIEFKLICKIEKFWSKKK